MRIRTLSLVLSLVLLTATAAPSASAQPSSAATGRVSLDVGVSGARAAAGQTMVTDAVMWVGADLPISRRWSLRAEIGRRWPSRRVSIYHSEYDRATLPAGSPASVMAANVVDGVTVVEGTSLFDLAILMRARWPVRQRFEIAALLGPDIRFIRSRSTLTIPWSAAEPYVSEQPRKRYALDRRRHSPIPLFDRFPLPFPPNVSKIGSRPLFEYACHEGNHGVCNISGGARAAERAGEK